VICTVGAFRDELLLVTIVAEPLGFLPSVGYGCCGFCIYPITTPQLPVFAVRVNYVEHCHFDRAHSFASMGKTSYALEPMMHTILVFLDKIVAELASVFSSPSKLTILDRKALRIFAYSIFDDAFK